MILLMVMVVMMVIVIMMMMITLMKMVIMIKMIVMMMMMMVIIRCGGTVYQAEQVLTRAGPCHLLCLACNNCG